MANIVSIISNALVSQQSATTTVQKTITPIQGNPFSSGNPFVNMNARFDSTLYAKNKPIEGGYFAGYYNGKANIVGKRLFIEA